MDICWRLVDYFIYVKYILIKNKAFLSNCEVHLELKSKQVIGLLRIVSQDSVHNKENGQYV